MIQQYIYLQKGYDFKMANRDAKLIERTLKDFSLNVMSGSGVERAGRDMKVKFKKYINLIYLWKLLSLIALFIMMKLKTK